jgi:hypothetical protein
MTVFQTLQQVFGPLGLARLPFALPVASTTLPLLLAFIITNWVQVDQTQDKLLNPEASLLSVLSPCPKNLAAAAETYDFIVVGSGTISILVLLFDNCTDISSSGDFPF